MVSARSERSDLSAGLVMLLLKHLCDVVLHRTQLLVDMLQECIQVCPVQLTALHQHLRPHKHQSFTSAISGPILQSHTGSNPHQKCSHYVYLSYHDSST